MPPLCTGHDLYHLLLWSLHLFTVHQNFRADHVLYTSYKAWSTFSNWFRSWHMCGFQAYGCCMSSNRHFSRHVSWYVVDAACMKHTLSDLLLQEPRSAQLFAACSNQATWSSVHNTWCNTTSNTLEDSAVLNELKKHNYVRCGCVAGQYPKSGVDLMLS